MSEEAKKKEGSRSAPLRGFLAHHRLPMGFPDHPRTDVEPVGDLAASLRLELHAKSEFKLTGSVSSSTAADRTVGLDVTARVTGADVVEAVECIHRELSRDVLVDHNRLWRREIGVKESRGQNKCCGPRCRQYPVLGSQRRRCRDRDQVIGLLGVVDRAYPFRWTLAGTVQARLHLWSCLYSSGKSVR